jgi:hypothetical protein
VLLWKFVALPPQRSCRHWESYINAKQFTLLT